MYDSLPVGPEIVPAFCFHHFLNSSTFVLSSSVNSTSFGGFVHFGSIGSPISPVKIVTELGWKTLKIKNILKYSRLRNKRAGTLINFWALFQQAWTLFHRVGLSIS